MRDEKRAKAKTLPLALLLFFLALDLALFILHPSKFILCSSALPDRKR